MTTMTINDAVSLALAEEMARDERVLMFGEGVALHFHAVRHDEIAHLVEEAEHLDRISLTRGLDDPAQVEAVEVFVPEGQVSRATDQPAARLPTMLARPMIASDQLATWAGRPHSATSPGRWVTRKAMWKPQVKKPACSSR